MKELDITKPVWLACDVDTILIKGTRVDVLRKLVGAQGHDRYVIVYKHRGLEYSTTLFADRLENCPEPIPDVYVYRTGGGTFVAFSTRLTEENLKVYGYKYVGHFPGDSIIRDSEG